MKKYNFTGCLKQGEPAEYYAAAEADTRFAKLERQVDALLQHCPDPECSECSKIMCPHGEPFHFHHDGCPACVTG